MSFYSLRIQYIITCISKVLCKFSYYYDLRYHTLNVKIPRRKKYVLYLSEMSGANKKNRGPNVLLFYSISRLERIGEGRKVHKNHICLLSCE